MTSKEPVGGASESRVTDHESRRFDVAIVGGGLIGAALAVALRRQHRSVALIEAAPPPAGTPSWDERCIAVNAASRNILGSLGLWDALAPQAAPILSTHISEAGRFGVARFTAAEADLPALGYNLPVRALGQLLWTQAGASGAAVLCPAQLDALKVTAGEVELRLHDGRTLRSRLVAAADGAQSGVRRLLDVGAQIRDYDQQAIVTAVRVSRSHQGCAYERFTPDGPIALLPKLDDPARPGSGQTCSMVWTLPTAQARARMDWSSGQFLAAAQEAFGERLGVFTELGQRGAHALQRVMSEQLTAPRLVFVGNAAQSLHPVAAQGFNLGLRDVAMLAEQIGDLPDPGEAAGLAEYARRRRDDRSDTAAFTDGLVRLFSNRVPGLSALRHLGLLALDLAPPLKQQMLWRNLGYRGLMPRAAR